MKKNLTCNIGIGMLMILTAAILGGCRALDTTRSKNDYPENTKGKIKTLRTDTALYTNTLGNWLESEKGIATTTTYEPDGQEKEAVKTTPDGALLFRTITNY